MHAHMQIVQLLGFKDAHVVGHSFGSFVASMLCQVYPEMVKSLVRHDLEEYAAPDTQRTA